jgi:Ca2+-binding EF-hand superfamily protein
LQGSREKKELITQFKAMDKNNDGTLSREELIEG